MTRSQAQQLWPVVREWCEGKTIQFRYLGSNGGWTDYTYDDLVMSNHYTEWRVKPTPRHFWLVAPKSNPSMPWSVWHSDPGQLEDRDIIHCIEAP